MKILLGISGDVLWTRIDRGSDSGWRPLRNGWIHDAIRRLRHGTLLRSHTNRLCTSETRKRSRSHYWLYVKIASIGFATSTNENFLFLASIFRALRIPGVLLAACSIIVTSMSIGFLQASLEPHLRQFGLSPVILGLMFVINGGTYAIVAPLWGLLCDRTCSPKIVTVMGTILVAIAFTLVGPAPYMHTKT